MKLSARDEAYLAEKQRREHAAEDAALRRAVAVAHAELEARCLRFRRSPTKREFTTATAQATNTHWQNVRAKKNAARR